MTTHEVDLASLPPQIRELVEEAARTGEVMLTREGEAVAKIVPLRRRPAPRRPGSAQGLIHMADDFDATEEIFHAGDSSVANEDLDTAYVRMAADETREAEAAEWSDALLPDMSDPDQRGGEPERGRPAQ